MNEPPLEEIVRKLPAMSAKLRELDEKIQMAVAAIERRLRQHGVFRVLSTKLPDGADLGWSYARRGNRWRFVIRDEDTVIDLMMAEPEERCEAFTCGAMEKLLRQAGIAV